MTRAKAYWAAERAKAVTVIARKPHHFLEEHVIPTLETTVVCAAPMICATNDGFQLDASFDSGADHSVVPPKT